MEPEAPQRPCPSRGWDATSVLTVYLVLLLAIPAQLVFEPLGGAGSPVQLLGLFMAGWWLVFRLARPWPAHPIRQPIRLAMIGLGVAVLLSYIAAMTRAIPDVELRAADRGMLMMISWTGVVMVAMDGIPSRERLDVLLRRLAMGGGLLALLGVVQFFTGTPFTDQISIPGLTANSGNIGSIMVSGDLARPSGTALHPIEFGVALTMILPVALHYALEDRHGGPVRRWFPVVAISLAIPISISRSALLGGAVVLVMMMSTWTPARRRITLMALVTLAAVLFVAIPGLLGRLQGLFTEIGTDSSALSRTGSYELAMEFINRAPLVGRGFGTFLPAYRILDNQYLGVLIELGVVGLIAVLALYGCGVFTARRVRSRSPDPKTRQLAQSIATVIVVGALSFALFDAFAFPMVSGLMFLALGLAGSLNRLESERTTVGDATPAPTETSGGLQPEGRWMTPRVGRAPLEAES